MFSSLNYSILPRPAPFLPQAQPQPTPLAPIHNFPLTNRAQYHPKKGEKNYKTHPRFCLEWAAASQLAPPISTRKTARRDRPFPEPVAAFFCLGSFRRPAERALPTARCAVKRVRARTRDRHVHARPHAERSQPARSLARSRARTCTGPLAAREPQSGRSMTTRPPRRAAPPSHCLVFTEGTINALSLRITGSPGERSTLPSRSPSLPPSAPPPPAPCRPPRPVPLRQRRSSLSIKIDAREA